MNPAGAPYRASLVRSIPLSIRSNPPSRPFSPPHDVWDETVIGPWGLGSSLHATSKRTERLLDQSEFARQVAAAPKEAAPSGN